MNQHHKEILEEIQKEAKKVDEKRLSALFLESYVGTPHKMYKLSMPVIRNITKNWASKNKNISLKEYIATLHSLFAGSSHEEKLIAGKILEYMPDKTKLLDPFLVDIWLNHLAGWGEIDNLCQSNFDGKIFLNNFAAWKKLIEQLRIDKNSAKRRASLVLLVKPVSTSDDILLTNVAFDTIDTLKHERNILITKAISWLLRSLIKHHKIMVADYIEHNRIELPKIAVRETTIKLATGKKK